MWWTHFVRRISCAWCGTSSCTFAVSTHHHTIDKTNSPASIRAQAATPGLPNALLDDLGRGALHDAGREAWTGTELQGDKEKSREKRNPRILPRLESSRCLCLSPLSVPLLSPPSRTSYFSLLPDWLPVPVIPAILRQDKAYATARMITSERISH